MPRPKRVAKSRRDGPPLHPAIAHYLTWRDFSKALELAGDDEDAIGAIYVDWLQYPQWWARIENEALGDWTRELPGTRPTSWWFWSAPELRQVVGQFTPISGAGRCHETGIPYMQHDPSNPPLVEAEPAYLDRLRLWLPGERARVPASAFAPELFSYQSAMTVSQGRRFWP